MTPGFHRTKGERLGETENIARKQLVDPVSPRIPRPWPANADVFPAVT